MPSTKGTDKGMDGNLWECQMLIHTLRNATGPFKRHDWDSPGWTNLFNDSDGHFFCAVDYDQVGAHG